MKKILIPTDFSSDSYKCIENVVQIFKNECCDFYFLNNYSFDAYSLNALEIIQERDEWFEKPKEKSQQQLGKMVAAFTSNSIEIKHRFHAISECSDILNSVKSHVELLNIDMVILSGGTKKQHSKINRKILENIRCCPILLIPPHSCSSKKIYLTVASDFKQEIKIDELEKFCEIFLITEVKATILVLDEKNKLSENVTSNIALFIKSFKKKLASPITVKYAKSCHQLESYASSHMDEIMCLVDKKPGVLRKLGLLKSNLFFRLKKMGNNKILTIHNDN